MLRLCLLILALQDQPLPDTRTFLSELRKTLQSDSALLGQYTYTEKETHLTLDSRGNTKKTETKVFQVFGGAERSQTYRRHISTNGVPLTEKEMAKQDREQKERIASESRKRQGQSEARRKQEKAKSDREDQEVIDDIFAMYDIQLVRREILEGIPVIQLTFKSRPGYKTKTRQAGIMKHIAGKAWIAEQDHQLAKLESEVMEPIAIGAGILAKVQKGSILSFERRKVNNEIWLPVKQEALINGRLLLFKGLNFRQVSEYSDHQKYSVDTILTFGDLPLKPKP